MQPFQSNSLGNMNQTKNEETHKSAEEASSQKGETKDNLFRYTKKFSAAEKSINKIVKDEHFKDFLARVELGQKFNLAKGAYIKYLGGGVRGFDKLFKNTFAAQETTDLIFYGPVIFSENNSWPFPSISISYFSLTRSSISGYYKLS